MREQHGIPGQNISSLTGCGDIDGSSLDFPGVAGFSIELGEESPTSRVIMIPGGDGQKDRYKDVKTGQFLTEAKALEYMAQEG